MEFSPPSLEHINCYMYLPKIAYLFINKLPAHKILIKATAG